MTHVDAKRAEISSARFDIIGRDQPLGNTTAIAPQRFAACG